VKYEEETEKCEHSVEWNVFYAVFRLKIHWYIEIKCKVKNWFQWVSMIRLGESVVTRSEKVLLYQLFVGVRCVIRQWRSLESIVLGRPFKAGKRVKRFSDDRSDESNQSNTKGTEVYHKRGQTEASTTGQSRRKPTLLKRKPKKRINDIKERDLFVHT
jgi:hypothetical protein